MKCSICGMEAIGNVTFCSSCGSNMPAQEFAQTPPSGHLQPIQEFAQTPSSGRLQPAQEFAQAPQSNQQPDHMQQQAQPQQTYATLQRNYQPQGQYPPQGQYAPQGQYPPHGQYYPQYVDIGKSAKVVGILALIFGCMGGFIGIILGCIGLSMSNKVLNQEPSNKSAQTGRICSTIGLVLGVIIMVAVVAANA